MAKRPASPSVQGLLLESQRFLADVGVNDYYSYVKVWPAACLISWARRTVTEPVARRSGPCGYPAEVRSAGAPPCGIFHGTSWPVSSSKCGSGFLDSEGTVDAGQDMGTETVVCSAAARESAFQSKASNATKSTAFKDSVRCRSSMSAEDREHGHNTTGMLFWCGVVGGSYIHAPRPSFQCSKAHASVSAVWYLVHAHHAAIYCNARTF